MKTISLKIDDDTFLETEHILEKLRKSRNRYINEALAFYNKIQRRKFLEQQFAEESNMVREESINVLKDFEAIDYED